MLKIITSELECPICLDIIKNPKTLNCLHSFCNDCITSKCMIITCPLCNAQTDKPKTDFFKKKLIDTINKYSNDLKETKYEKNDLGISFDAFYISEYSRKNEKCFINIRVVIVSNIPKWLHVYAIYTLDNWKTNHESGRVDFSPRNRKYFGYDISCVIEFPLYSTKKFVYFAICVYDDFGNYHWDNHDGWNYGFKLSKKIDAFPTWTSIDVKPLGNYY